MTILLGFNLLFLLAVLLNVEVLHQTPIELAEALLVLLVEEDLLYVAFVLQPLIQFVQQSCLKVPAFHLWSTTVAIVQSHGKYRGGI